jgi:hypothetical protein
MMAAGGFKIIYTNRVRTSQETHSFSKTASNLVQVSKDKATLVFRTVYTLR